MFINEAINTIKKEHKVADQYEMAKIIQVSQATISNYLKGTTYPQLPVAARIYGLYGLRCEPFTEKALQKEWDMIKSRL